MCVLTHMHSSGATAQGVQLYDIDMDTAGDGQLAELKKQIPGVKVICYIRCARTTSLRVAGDSHVQQRGHGHVLLCACFTRRHVQQPA
jgi:hypothetical protein